MTVALKDAPPAVHAGMTSDITITTASATNVLTVPAAALRGTAGSYSVLVMGPDGEPTAVPVQVGLVTNTTAEVKSGLTAGQTVVTGVNTPQTATSTNNGGFGGAIPAAAASVGTSGSRTATTMNDAIISFDHVSRVYDMGHVQVPALADVSMQVLAAASSSRSSDRRARARPR